MTPEQYNRLAHLGWLIVSNQIKAHEHAEYESLLKHWKYEESSKFDLRRLKPGNIIRNKATGVKFIVLHNTCHGAFVGHFEMAVDPSLWQSCPKNDQD